MQINLLNCYQLLFLEKFLTKICILISLSLFSISCSSKSSLNIVKKKYTFKELISELPQLTILEDKLIRIIEQMSLMIQRTTGKKVKIIQVDFKTNLNPYKGIVIDSNEMASYLEMGTFEEWIKSIIEKSDESESVINAVPLYSYRLTDISNMASFEIPILLPEFSTVNLISSSPE